MSMDAFSTIIGSVDASEAYVLRFDRRSMNADSVTVHARIAQHIDIDGPL